MNEAVFVRERQDRWSELERIVRKASRSSAGVRVLTQAELRRFGDLYRRTASDLAYARTQRCSESVTEYLNDLVGAAHGILYTTDTTSWRGIRPFFVEEIPRTFRRRLPFFWAALLFTTVGATLAYGLVTVSPANIDYFVPEGHFLRPSLDAWTSGSTVRAPSDPQSVVYASALMINNIQVSLTAFALGVLGAVITAYILLNNGMVLGAFAAMVGHAGKHGTFWPGVIPHGVVEISEMLMVGAAGLSLGWALLAPGSQSRREALAAAARDAVKLLLAGIILLVFAGLTEGFLSHAPLPNWLKIAVGVASGTALYVYLFRSGAEASTVASDVSTSNTD